MDLHSFYLRDPDLHSICGSGFSRGNFSNKNSKNARKLLIHKCKYIQFFKVNLHKSLLFPTFEQSLMFFLTTIENSALVYFYKFC